MSPGVTLFVDPGVHACGAALFDGPALVAAGFPEAVDRAKVYPFASRSDFWRDTVEALRRWVASQRPAAYPSAEPSALFIELPQVYDRAHMSKRKRGTDPNDLIELAAVVGAICSAFSSAKQYVALPREWKGTMPKEIMHARAIAAPGEVNPLGGTLTPSELASIPKLPKTKLHNVLDAVCMGLVFSGRMRTGGSAFDGNPARAGGFAPARRSPIGTD